MLKQSPLNFTETESQADGSNKITVSAARQLNLSTLRKSNFSNNDVQIDIVDEVNGVIVENADNLSYFTELEGISSLFTLYYLILLA